MTNLTEITVVHLCGRMIFHFYATPKYKTCNNTTIFFFLDKSLEELISYIFKEISMQKKLLYYI